MKWFYYLLGIPAGLSVVYNIFLVDFKKPFSGDSLVALCCIAAAFCVLILLRVFYVSKKIERLKKTS